MQYKCIMAESVVCISTPHWSRERKKTIAAATNKTKIINIKKQKQSLARETRFKRKFDCFQREWLE